MSSVTVEGSKAAMFGTSNLIDLTAYSTMTITYSVDVGDAWIIATTQKIADPNDFIPLTLGGLPQGYVQTVTVPISNINQAAYISVGKANGGTLVVWSISLS